MSEWDPDFDEWMRRFFGRSRFRWGIGGTRDILSELEQMKKEMERMMKEQFEEQLKIPKDLVKEYETPEGAKIREVGPIVYGYSMTIGPDGKPRIREFGNVHRAGLGSPKLTTEREPLADVITSDRDVKVVIELPGVNKEDIGISAHEGIVEISAKTPDRKYHREIEVPPDADVKTAKSTYKNGILEIIFQKKTSKGRTEIKID